MKTVGGLSGSSMAGMQAGGLLSSLTSARTIGGLQAGSSVLAGLGQMGADTSRAASYGIQAGEWGTQAKDENVMATNQVAGLKSQYLNAVGGETARMASGGVDVGQGVGQQSRNVIGQNAANAGQLDTLASDIRARRDTINQIGANEAADQANSAGVLGLVGGILGGGLKLMSSGIL
jgi:hypothetical protein